MGEVIPHWLTKQAYLLPNQIAIESMNEDALTFLELKVESKKYAKRLARLGVKRGTHVGMFCTNEPLMVIAIHAVSYLGGVVVLLNTRLTKHELSHQIIDSNISLLITCGKLEKEIKQHKFHVTVKTHQAIKGLEEKQVTLQTEMNLNDPFTIMYTSGTTGSPKGVVHTYGNHWWSAIGSGLNLGIHKDDKWLNMLPIFHVGGLSVFIKSVIYGMPVFLLENYSAPIVNEVIIKRGVTIVSVVTLMLKQMIDELGTKHYPAAFRCMLLGGGPAPVSLLENAKEQYIPVFQSYGMTETSSQIVTLSPSDAMNKIGSAGKPLFPGQLKIKNKDADLIGEIHVKGPMVTKGYYNNPDNKKLLKDDWLATGDLGYLDNEGFLYVVDRRNDLIISGGENIYPSEIENVIYSLKEVKEVGVVGKPDETWGQIPIACIVVNEEISVEEIKSYLQAHLAAYKIPKQIYFVEKLPRNATNKLLRNSLLKIIE